MSLIVPEVAKAIWEELVDVYMPLPKESDWQDIAEQFRVNRDFPNCIGAIDGKHVRIVAPPNSGSLFLIIRGPSPSCSLQLSMPTSASALLMWVPMVAGVMEAH